MQTELTTTTRMQDELGRFLGTFAWDHFATLTHRFDGTEQTQIREVQRLVRRLERVAQQKVKYAAFSERTTDGFLHHHVLLYGTGRLTKQEIRTKWRSGYSSVEAYDPERGAAAYVAKAYGRPAGVTFDLSESLPPLAGLCAKRLDAHPREERAVHAPRLTASRAQSRRRGQRKRTRERGTGTRTALLIGHQVPEPHRSRRRPRSTAHAAEPTTST